MKRDLVIQVFATLQSLEKALNANKRTLREPAKGSEPSAAGTAIRQQERCVHQMRRTANRLQFELACDNWIEVVRLLKIFYGLHYMVRPEILKTASNLSRPEPREETPATTSLFH